MAKTTQTKKKRNTWGGARANAGRKVIDDRKEPVTVYIRQSTIEYWGGREAVKAEMVQFCENIRVGVGKYSR